MCPTAVAKSCIMGPLIVLETPCTAVSQSFNQSLHKPELHIAEPADSSSLIMFSRACMTSLGVLPDCHCIAFNTSGGVVVSFTKGSAVSNAFKVKANLRSSLSESFSETLIAPDNATNGCTRFTHAQSTSTSNCHRKTATTNKETPTNKGSWAQALFATGLPAQMLHILRNPLHTVSRRTLTCPITATGACLEAAQYYHQAMAHAILDHLLFLYLALPSTPAVSISQS